MKFTCYTHWDDLPESSSILFDNAAKHSVFFSAQWFENLIATALKDHQHVLLACVISHEIIEESRVMAILPLISRDNKEWSSLCHSYSSLYSLLLAEKDQLNILNCLVNGLKGLPFDYLTLEPIAEDDSDINRLQQTLESSGFSCHRHFRFYNWFHRTHGKSYAKYLADRPSKVRNTIHRKQRKLERDHGLNIHLCTNAADDIKRALADYHELYKVSWKANEQYEKIVQGFTYNASESGWTRLAILYVEDQPIAAHLWFVVDKKASIFRLVYDQNWKQYSPGTILMNYLMEHVIDVDKVEEIDFLTGNDRYKQDWMSERRERYGLTFVKKVKKSETEIKETLLTKVSGFFKKLRN